VKTTITVRTSFAAAHYLPQHRGKCSRLHGHTYSLEVTVEGEPQQSGPATGMVMDFAELKEQVHKLVVRHLDHQVLNDVLDILPTTETVAAWALRQLQEAGLPVTRIRLAEGPDSYVEVTL